MLTQKKDKKMTTQQQKQRNEKLVQLVKEGNSYKQVAEILQNITAERVRQISTLAGVDYRQVKQQLAAEKFVANLQYIQNSGLKAYDTNEIYWVSKNGEQVLKRDKNNNFRPLALTQPSHKYGYPRVSINGENMYVHRLVYTTFNGRIPKHLTVDHIDGNHCNNNLSNLRLLTKQENSRLGMERTRAEGKL